MDDVTTAITYHAPTGIPWVVEQAEYQDGTQAALDYRATVSAADTIVTYTEMYTTLDRL